MGVNLADDSVQGPVSVTPSKAKRGFSRRWAGFHRTLRSGRVVNLLPILPSPCDKRPPEGWPLADPARYNRCIGLDSPFELLSRMDDQP